MQERGTQQVAEGRERRRGGAYSKDASRSRGGADQLRFRLAGLGAPGEGQKLLATEGWRQVSSVKTQRERLRLEEESLLSELPHPPLPMSSFTIAAPIGAECAPALSLVVSRRGSCSIRASLTLSSSRPVSLRHAAVPRRQSPVPRKWAVADSAQSQTVSEESSEAKPEEVRPLPLVMVHGSL